ncbi:GGDEF domain-containing protein [uncultured Ferrimonas sp.]|uniref:diguanylate cyclase n=1 Tax=uncultured Ferrimonas sp. TaxID=432640 RepID=UPI002614AC29|nr:GGDEF domain-containing protein [uncultured Ferrimonas sp.]
MTDNTPAASTQELLEQQLVAAQQSQRKLLTLVEANQAQIRGLLDCVQQLTLSCKGQDLELDTRLAKLRSRLTSESNVQALLPELAELCQVLQDRSEQGQLELKSSQDAMASLARNIAIIDDIPDQMQRELTYFQQELSRPTYSVWDHLPKINKLTGFYQSLLMERIEKGEPIPATNEHQQLAHELAHLLSDLEFRPEERDPIAALKAELAGSVTVERLLQAYQQVLNLLMGEIVREKNSSHQFLSAINECLNVVRDSVNDNWAVTVRNFGHQRDSNRQISNQCIELGDHVRNATELDDLKRHISSELLALRQILKQRESEQHSDFVRLKNSMDSMRKELATLGNEASGYKEKLVEQQKLNMVDTLTQLPNRAALDEHLKREYRNVRRYGSKLWVAVADIDHFKNVNDSYGHSTGDKTLQVVAMALKNSLRKEEFVARYGGEEFVLLLPEVNQEQVLQILNRTRDKIRTIPFKFRSERLSITVSIGAAQVGENETIQETFERADAALYRAKRNGRNRVELDQ